MCPSCHSWSGQWQGLTVSQLVRIFWLLGFLCLFCGYSLVDISIPVCLTFRCYPRPPIFFSSRLLSSLPGHLAMTMSLYIFLTSGYFSFHMKLLTKYTTHSCLCWEDFPFTVSQGHLWVDYREATILFQLSLAYRTDGPMCKASLGFFLLFRLVVQNHLSSQGCALERSTGATVVGTLGVWTTAHVTSFPFWSS
jgi:hypothetical protein